MIYRLGRLNLVISTNVLLRIREISSFVSLVVVSARRFLLLLFDCSITLLLSVQLKNMTTDPKKEEEEEKDPVAKKED